MHVGPNLCQAACCSGLPRDKRVKARPLGAWNRHAGTYLLGSSVAIAEEPATTVTALRTRGDSSGSWRAEGQQLDRQPGRPQHRSLAAKGRRACLQFCNDLLLGLLHHVRVLHSKCRVRNDREEAGVNLLGGGGPRQHGVQNRLPRQNQKTLCSPSGNWQRPDAPGLWRRTHPRADADRGPGRRTQGPP